jgi:uncharacterized protein (DUF1015 family)
MAIVIPFKGILYNPDKVSGDAVIAPPYDIISPEHREALYQKSPYNIVRIDFGKDSAGDDEKNNKYTRAKDCLEQWLKDGIFIRDDEPAFYSYEVEYELSGSAKKLSGIMAMVKIEELGKGVYPHEATHSKPKADRLDLMNACMANTSPIYALYNSPEKITSGIIANIKEKPFLTARDPDGALHKICRISDRSKIEAIAKEFADKAIFIADGHHRYEVALEFKRQMGQGPWEYVLMFLANMSDEGITALPTHRMVKGIPPKEEMFKRLEQDFDINKLTDADVSKAISNGKNTFGLYLDREEGWYILKYRGGHLENLDPALRTLDVAVLHELILKKDMGITDVAYEMDAKEAMSRVKNGDFEAVFFLNPTAVGDVERVALSGLRMPPKSTYFYPKLLTGMVINSFK